MFDIQNDTGSQSDELNVKPEIDPPLNEYTLYPVLISTIETLSTLNVVLAGIAIVKYSVDAL
mgnify:CR=1 FL=1|jgi:hypothetical protein